MVARSLKRKKATSGELRQQEEGKLAERAGIS